MRASPPKEAGRVFRENTVTAGIRRAARATRDKGASNQRTHNIAETLYLEKRHFSPVLRLAFLAPDIQLEILDGTQSRDLLQKDLIYPSLSISWYERLQ